MDFSPETAGIGAVSNDQYFGGWFTKNNLFILVETVGNEERPAGKIGKEILDLISTNYRSKNESSLDYITSLLQEAKKAAPEFNTLTIGILKGNILYLGNIGFGEVLLERNGEIGRILSSDETSSGKVQTGDLLLFSSKTFCRCIAQKERRELLQINDWRKSAETGSSLLSRQTEPAGAVALIVTFSKTIKPKEPLFNLTKPITAKFHEKIPRLVNQFRLLLKKLRPSLSEDSQETRPQKNLLTIAVVLVILLVASIFLNINHTNQSQKHKRFSESLDLVLHQYEEAVSLIDLNPTRARTLLSSSKLSLSPYLSEFSKSSNEYKQINEWLDKISEKEVAAYKIYKLTSVPLYYDITLIKQGGIGGKIAAYRQMKAILDTQNKVAYSLSSDTKQAAIIAGSNVVDEAKTIAIHGKTAYFLTKEGITGVDIQNKTAKVVIAKDEKWGEIISVASFGGNLYLLDSQNNAIWKYIATESGFSSRTSYLNPGVQADFSKARQMIIDGSVWVLNSSGEILKYTSGLGEAFSFKGLADTISNIEALFTSDVEKSLYLLDKNASRVLVFDKDGTYFSQYQWDGLKDASDFVVSEDEKKIFVLAGAKIYAIDIK